MTPEERRAELDAIAAEVRNCTRCPLSAQRTNAVPGEGDPETEVAFVGEGPGYNEDQAGRPFVGAAGGLLNELLAAIGWRREQVFITNIVKCRPPGNRDPEPAEIAACTPYLRRQLEVLDPALVVTLGRHSLQTFMPGERIGAAHGTLRPVEPETGARDALAYALYHPAAALRQNSLRQTMLIDIAGVPEALLQARQRRHAARQSTTPPAEAHDTASPASSYGPQSPASVTQPQPEPVGVTAASTDPDNQMELF